MVNVNTKTHSSPQSANEKSDPAVKAEKKPNVKKSEPVHGYFWRLGRGALAFLAMITLFPALCAWSEVKKLWIQAYTGRESARVDQVAKKVKFNSRDELHVFDVEKLGSKQVGPSKFKTGVKSKSGG